MKPQKQEKPWSSLLEADYQPRVRKNWPGSWPKPIIQKAADVEEQQARIKAMFAFQGRPPMLSPEMAEYLLDLVNELRKSARLYEELANEIRYHQAAPPLSALGGAVDRGKKIAESAGFRRGKR